MTTHACGGIKDDTLVTGVEAQQEELLTSKTSMDVETEEQNHRVSCALQTVSADRVMASGCMMLDESI
jgi:hypothetical protein